MSPRPTFKPGDLVRYYPSGRGYPSYTGRVRGEPFLLDEQTWVVHLHEMDATYKRGECSIVHAASCDALDLLVAAPAPVEGRQLAREAPVTPTDTDRFLAEVRARLAALPPHLSIERHGDGEAIYSCRDQPIDPDWPVSHTNLQHGWQVAFVREYDSRMWPPVRAFLTSAPGDVARLLAIVEELGREVLRLRSLPPSSPASPTGAPAAGLSAAAAGSEGGSASCTGLTARWCPRCGDCTCPLPEGGAGLDDPCCPLHGLRADHPDAHWLESKLAREVELGELPPGGASGGAARSPVCPDCRGEGRQPGSGGAVCLTCAGWGLIGGGR